MVFTIGGLREVRDGSAGTRRRTRGSLCSLIAEYTGTHGWTVVPGARLVRGGRCDCGDACCPSPGAHPLAFAAPVAAGARYEEVAAAWPGGPQAAVLLAVGGGFDVLDVPEEAGCRALVRLERMGLRPGPVLATPDGRARFFVAPGAAAELPHLLYRLGWDGAGLDLRCLGPGDHVTAPPSEVGALGPVRWLRPPSAERRPPEARLLLGTLAYVAHRHAPLVRS